MRAATVLGAAVLGAAACAAPPRVAPPPQPPAPRCAASVDADFEGTGEEELRRFLAWLAQAHGGSVSLRSDEVSLGIVRGQAKPGPAGVTAAEISCDAAGYRITLFRNALSGRSLAVVYDTLAHEFHHIVQVRRDGLACEAPPGQRARYEQEASAFAARVVPKCRSGPVVPAKRG